MMKKIRSAIASAALAWAWKNRSQVISFVKNKINGDTPPDTPPTGYGNTAGNDGIVDPAVA